MDSGPRMTLVTTDVTMTNGRRAVMCTHAAASWPTLAELAEFRGHGELRIYQAYGFADASGGTHAHGTSLDVNTASRTFNLLAREAGWDASWPRGKAFGQNFMDHSHLVIRCPCNPNSAAYQTSAVLAGYDGLGAGGRGGRDYIARPSAWRDWKAGLAWAKAELAKYRPPPPPPPPPEDEDPPMFLASTPSWDTSSPDKTGGKICLVVPGKVIWCSPDKVGLWLRALPESLTKFRGSPFLWVQLEEMAADMAAGFTGTRDLAIQPEGFNFPEGERGATVDDLAELLS